MKKTYLQNGRQNFSQLEAPQTILERGGNKPFEALGQCTHTRKSGIGTARRRCICQPKVERTLGGQGIALTNSS